MVREIVKGSTRGKPMDGRTVIPIERGVFAQAGKAALTPPKGAKNDPSGGHGRPTDVVARDA